MIGLREKVYDAIKTHYKPGDEVSPYVIADACGSVNAVFHIMHTFAEEGILDLSFQAVCPDCKTQVPVNSIDVGARGWTRCYCGLIIPVKERFIYHLPKKK